MVGKYVRAVRDSGIMDWVLLGIGIGVIGLGIAYAKPATDNGAREAPAISEPN